MLPTWGVPLGPVTGLQGQQQQTYPPAGRGQLSGLCRRLSRFRVCHHCSSRPRWRPNSWKRDMSGATGHTAPCTTPLYTSPCLNPGQRQLGVQACCPAPASPRAPTPPSFSSRFSNSRSGLTTPTPPQGQVSSSAPLSPGPPGLPNTFPGA